MPRPPRPSDPFSGFFYARKMHMDNLLHHPLPDTVAPRPYRSPGPPSLMDVRRARPDTCKPAAQHTHMQQERPKTCGEKQMALKNMSPMDLAICWDFRTINPRDEPKRTKHIDGSNGSLAPAVFSMVHSPKQVNAIQPDTGKSNPIFSHNVPPDDVELGSGRVVPSFERDMSRNRRKEACAVPKCKQHEEYEQPSSSICSRDRRQAAQAQHNNTHRHTKSAAPPAQHDGNNNCKENHRERRRSLDHLHVNGNTPAAVATNLIKSKMHQSSPNVSKLGSNKSKSSTSCGSNNCHMSRGARPCEACDTQDVDVRKDNKRQEYKMAFKAGNPNSVGSSDSHHTKNSYKVPKMRDPYSKKTYAAPTLAPPFSRWRDAGGYPEHWRLASVYQRTYRPPANRRPPLLPAVYS